MHIGRYWRIALDSQKGRDWREGDSAEASACCPDLIGSGDEENDEEKHLLTADSEGQKFRDKAKWWH